MRFLSTITRLALLMLVMLMLANASFGQVGISITIGPPPLPVYAQPLCLVKATSGPRGTGPTGPTAITGYRAPGYWLRKSVISGHRAGGDGAGADSSSMKVIGDHVSVSMAGLSTDMVISVAATMAGVGRVIASSTIVR